MPNTVYGPFAAINVVNGTTPVNATWGNNAQTQASTAINGINPDLSGPFVLSGITCTKDGTNANQLDIASGTAYVTFSDGTTGKIAVVADNTHTTVTPSATYYLFLLNNGTWQWGTTGSGPVNSLPICQVTTDGSGNISTVTDVRHTAGSGGVGLVVARVLNLAITVTTLQQFVGYVVPIRGMYAVHFVATYSNASPGKPIAYVRWEDPNLAVYATANFMLISSSAAGTILTGTQSIGPGNNQGLATMPISMYAEAGSTIGVYFQDPGGTPNCHVSAVVIRLS